jgi:signal transduction histidine kinase
MGLGLGLPTAKMIVDRHGGHFAMMSEVGRGTEVFLTFPARPAGIVVKQR